jgi:hypothetical protein
MDLELSALSPELTLLWSRTTQGVAGWGFVRYLFLHAPVRVPAGFAEASRSRRTTGIGMQDVLPFHSGDACKPSAGWPEELGSTSYPDSPFQTNSRPACSSFKETPEQKSGFHV